MALSTDQFCDHLTASGLLSAEDLSALLASLPEDRQPRDGEQLARELVRQKKLTKYQAEQIYAGKGKGLVLGNYTILDKLGQGGMGMVLKAEHKRLKRLVAIKVMSPAAVKTPDALKRFHREVEAAAKLRHPNVVATDDADEAKGTHFLVMEYVEGSDLSALVKKKGPLPVAQAVQCIIQAARGLEFAHQQGVVHRDIKPANLLIDAKGTVKILDMGLARIEGDTGGQAELTSTGAVMGTVDYMAPEQALNTKTADARSDIYSLGISLWYLLAGKCAYDGDTLMAKLLAHRDAPIPSLCTVRSDVPASVDAVFQKMVAKQAKDRYQTMTEVIHELEAYQNGTASASTSSVTAPSISDESNVMSFLSSLGSLGTSSHPQITKQQAAPTATYAPADPTAEATLLTGDLAETTDPKTMTSVRARANRMQRATPNQVIAPPWYLDLKVKIGAAFAAVLLLLGVVFLFQTPNGTLRVEILDPEVEMKVKGTQLTFRSTDLKPVSVEPGEAKLLVTRGDLSFETETFTLKKGTETRVKVELMGDKLVVNGGGKMIAEQPIQRRGITASTTGSDSVASKSPTSNGAAPPLAIAPFDAAQAKEHQQAWAKHLGTEVVKSNSIGMQMTLIPPGEFLMGSSDADITLALKIAKETKLDLGGVNRIQEERPQHLVRITKPFRLAAHEVTIGQFAKFVEQTKYKTQAEEFGGDSGTVKPEEVKPDDLKKTWRSPGYSVTDDSPVTQVSWNDAVVYCNWLSEQEKLEPCYQRNGDTWTLLPKANGYRLPTEAEWEYACRAGTTTQYSFGNDWQEHDKYGWSNKNAVGCSHAVGSLPANPFGLYDMHGNVWEWCQDWYDSKWYEKSPSDNPLGPSGPSSRLHRGGGWNDLPACSRSSYRYSISTPSSRASNRGFRPALSSVGAATSVTASSQPVTPTSSAGRNTPKFTNTFGMEFALVPKGKSWLGGGGGKPGEQEVEIKQDFYMGVYEVTQEEWEKVTGKNPSEFSRNGTKKIVVLEIADADLKRFPVELVTWGDCQEFIKTLNEQVKETGWVYRLPTEVEWEYACRGGPMTDKAESAFDFYLEKPTNTLLASQANFFYTNLNRTTKVGSYSPNRLGLYDMHGNIGEWCLDEFPAAPNVPNGAVQHAVRGGSFDTRNEFRRTSFTKTYPLSFGRHCGLRLVRVPVGGVGTTTSVTPQPATSSKLFMHDPAFPQWLKDVQAMSAEKQIEAVSKKLMELNPGFDGSFSNTRGQPRIENGLVMMLGFRTDKVTDISPLRALVGLNRLWAIGAGPDRGKLSDLSPLRGMKLVELNFGWNPGISDLSPLNGTPLENLNIDDTRVEDLSALKGTPLKTLNICNTPVSDLSPLQGMPLTELLCHDTPVSDVSPLHDCKTLRSLNIRNTNVTPAAVAALQKALPNCKIEWDDPAKATTPQPAASSKLFMHDPAFPQWMKDVQAMSAEKQIEAVRKKLMELNPGFDGKLTGPYVSGEPVIKDGVVIEVEFRSDAVADLSPVRAFSSLRVFGCLGVDPKANQLTDLAPLQGVRLTKVSISNTRISDLSPLKGMPLYYLFADNTQVSSLTPLEGMPLTTAWCYGTPVSDLSPLAKCKGLKSLRVKSTKVPPAAVAALQKALPDCKIEWDGPAKATTPQPETSSKLFMHDPAFPQWMKDVQAMTAVNQVDAVGKKLKELNPGFDEKLEHKIERDRVIELLFVTDHVTDISPVRALSGLKRLTCRGSAWKGALTDLRPVAGMQLQVFIADGNPKLADISQLKGLPLNELGLYSCHQVEDLSPVKGMPLNRLNIGNTKAMDLSSLQGMPLKSLNLFNCPARDLSPLKGMPLEELSIHTFDKVEDLTPIQSLPLKAISCVNKTERDVALLRSLKTVNKINSKPVAEFWKELDGK